MRVFYFGCWSDYGHFLYDHNGKEIGFSHKDFPWKSLDGVLCPKDTRKEGVVKFHHANGWTAAAFWDSSIDTRPGSNSVLIVEDLIDITEVICEFRETFPHIYKRFNFDLVEWLIPEERTTEDYST